jgi:hypothetical protein
MRDLALTAGLWLLSRGATFVGLVVTLTVWAMLILVALLVLGLVLESTFYVLLSLFGGAL